MAIASDGFVFVPRCVDDTTLQALRAEADSLFRLKRATDALSEDEYFDKVLLTVPRLDVERFSGRSPLFATCALLL